MHTKASKPLQEELATISWSSKGIKSISGTTVHFLSQIIIFLFGFEAKFVTLYGHRTKVIPKTGPDGFVHSDYLLSRLSVLLCYILYFNSQSLKICPDHFYVIDLASKCKKLYNTSNNFYFSSPKNMQ